MQSNRNSQTTKKEMFSNFFSAVAGPSPFVIASTWKVRGNPYGYLLPFNHPPAVLEIASALRASQWQINNHGEIDKNQYNG